MKFHFNYFTDTPTTVGLDIGDTHVRALQLAGSRTSATIVAYAESPLSKATSDIDGKVDTEGLAHVVEGLFVRPTFGRFTSKDVILNLPEAKCFVRVIHVASMGDSEIDAAVPFEAESYIPVPIDQVYLDWQRLGEADGRVALLLVASPKVFVDQVLNAVSQAGLVCTALKVESQGLTACLLPPATKGAVCIVNIKTNSTDLIMTEHGNIQFSSSIPIAGNSITDALARGLDVPPARAEEIKMQTGFGNTEEYPNVKTIMAPVMNSFLAEVKQVMAFHDQHSNEVIDSIFVVGGGARLKHLTEFLQESFTDRPSLKVSLGDPTINVHLALPPSLTSEDLLAYAAAVGLAMENLV